MQDAVCTNDKMTLQNTPETRTQTISSPTGNNEPLQEEFNFECKEEDNIREKFEIIGIQMDFHKTGILYLKELPQMLAQLPEAQRKPVGDFLVAYMKQTRKVSINLPLFISNILKAYSSGKFNLVSIVNQENEDFHMNEEEITSLESIVKAKPIFSPSKSVPAKLASRKYRTEPKMGRTSRLSVESATKYAKKPLPPKTVSPNKKPIIRSPMSNPERKNPRTNATKKSNQKVVSHTSVGKYAKIAQIKSEIKAAPRSSYERPTQACLLRHHLNAFIQNKECTMGQQCKKANAPAITSGESTASNRQTHNGYGYARREIDEAAKKAQEKDDFEQMAERALTTENPMKKKELANSPVRKLRSPCSTRHTNLPPLQLASGSPAKTPHAATPTLSPREEPRQTLAYSKELHIDKFSPRGTETGTQNFPNEAQIARISPSNDDAVKVQFPLATEKISPRENLEAEQRSHKKVWPVLMVSHSNPDSPGRSSPKLRVVPGEANFDVKNRRDRPPQPQQKQQRMMKMFGRSDSISEDVEFTYEEDFDNKPVKPKNNFISLSPSVSLLNIHGDEKTPKLERRKRNFNRAFSFDAGPKISPHGKLNAAPLLLSRNSARGSRGNLTPREEDLNLHLDFQEPTTMTLGDLMSISRIVAEAKDKNNIYCDIKSQKKLECVLRNGYTYKFQERKHYKGHQTYKGVQKHTPTKDVQNTKQLEMEILNALKLGSLSPRLGCNESIVHRQESTSSLNSTRQIYNEMFSDKISAQPTEYEPSERLQAPNIEVKLNTVKTNRMYKDLNIDPGLREVFGGFNYKQLMEIKKLHLLYAHQKSKVKTQP